jgi:hypothetical protein
MDRELLKKLAKATVNPIAYAWVLKKAEKELSDLNLTALDIIVRLQILEGVSGRSKQEFMQKTAWWRRGRVGLKYMQELMPDANPIWFSDKNTGTYVHLVRGTTNLIRKYKLDGIVTAEDVLNTFLLNMPLYIQNEHYTDTKVLVPLLWGVGVHLRRKIVRGKEEPKTVLNSAFFHLAHKLQTMAKKSLNNPSTTSLMPEDDDGVTMDYEDVSSHDRKSVSDMLLELFLSPQTEFHKYVWDIMDKLWFKNFKNPRDVGSRLLTLFLKHMEKRNFDEAVSLRELTAIYNETFPEDTMTEQNTNYHWKKEWDRLLSVLEKDNKLIRDLDSVFMTMGMELDVDYDFKKFVQRFRDSQKRGKVASVRKLSKLARIIDRLMKLS